ncbi:MAG: fuconate dehydratase, partial [Acidimicrobiia bacterium]
MGSTLAALDVIDVRFPTSRHRDGSDAMNPDPDYSAAYVVVKTDSPTEPHGHGFTFTIGRGTEVCVAAIKALQPLVVGLSTDAVFSDMG